MLKSHLRPLRVKGFSYIMSTIVNAFYLYNFTSSLFGWLNTSGYDEASHVSLASEAGKMGLSCCSPLSRKAKLCVLIFSEVSIHIGKSL